MQLYELYAMQQNIENGLEADLQNMRLKDFEFLAKYEGDLYLEEKLEDILKRNEMLLDHLQAVEYVLAHSGVGVDSS